jgi:dethiobiotin synthetase
MQRAPRPLFVAATRQHVGKTSVSLALMAGLKKRLGPNVGFIKPVGQQHKEVHDAHGRVLRVDKDVELLKEYFSLDHLEYNQMSPVLMPKDYTKAYIDGGITSADQESAIRASYDAVEKTSVRVLLEGTGHVGVGSVVELSNARVAAQLGAEMILVANGGIGSAFDELELNRVMCEKHGVPIKGVVLNKVKEDKLAMVRDYFILLLEPIRGIIMIRTRLDCGDVPLSFFLRTSNQNKPNTPASRSRLNVSTGRSPSVGRKPTRCSNEYDCARGRRCCR